MNDDNQFSEIAKSMHMCRILAQVLPTFYHKTGISANLNFFYSLEHDGMGFEISFSPHPPTKEEWSFFLEEIFDSEKIIFTELFVSSSFNFENINQMVFKYKEEAKNIISKRVERDEG